MKKVNLLIFLICSFSYGQVMHILSNQQKLKSNIEVIPPVQSTDSIRFIMTGASITKGFSDSTILKPLIAETFPDSKVELFNEALVATSVNQWAYFHIYTVLDKYTYDPNKNTYVFIHIGGNDVSQTKPFSTATAQEKSSIASDVERIIDEIEAKGFIPILSDLTFRDYDDITHTSEELGSKPYNDSIFRPIILNRTPNFAFEDGQGYMQLYTNVYNNYETWLSSDNVHMSLTGYDEIRNLFVNNIVGFILTGIPPSKIDADTDTTPPTAPSNLASTNIDNDFIELSWTSSTDANPIIYYNVYNNGVFVTTTPNAANSYTLQNLLSNTTYTLTLTGVDESFNESGVSNTLIVTTLENNSSSVAVITGELKQYHKTTLTWDAISLSEAPATYLDYRMNVTITAPSNETFVVPAYFAADGDAAETSAISGNKWRCHFTPKEVGTYDYALSFRTGTNIAANLSPTAGTTTSINGDAGTFIIGSTDKTGDDFRAKGKLQYIGEKAAQFDNGSYYFEVGTDSPETFLEYDDFDATTARHDFADTAANYEVGDPSWQGGKGTEIIGAVNYLANEGMNIHYMLTMNIDGDGNFAYPFPNNTAHTTYDISKLDQWQIVFDHMYNKGIAIEMVFLEQENLNWFEDQELSDRTGFGIARKLYYREMIARFGYLNVIYNIGEEANEDAAGDVYTAQQIEDAAEFVQDLSPYNDLVSVHNGPSNAISIFAGVANLAGTNHLTAISRQADYNNLTHTHDQFISLNTTAVNDGTKWVLRLTEPYIQGVLNLETWTDFSLWSAFTAGAVGIHYYDFDGDIFGEDYTTYQPYFERMKYAKDFFEDNSIPFWNMNNNDANISDGYLLSDNTDYFVGFLPNGGSRTITISGSDAYTVKWFDPRNGGALQDGSVTSLVAGTNVSLGTPPNNTTSSWVVYLNQNILADATPPSAPTNFTASNITSNAANLTWTAATDNVGVTGYKIYNNGSEIASLGNVTSYTLSGLSGSTTYDLTIRALDTANNESVNSNVETFTTEPIEAIVNMAQEDEYFSAYLLPISQKDSLQSALDTYGSVRLEAGNYGRLRTTPIYMTSNQRLYGHPTQTQIPDIRIAAGSSNVEIVSVHSYQIFFDAGAPITDCVLKSIKNTEIQTVGAQLEDNLFIHINSTVNFDCSASGYLRNNRFYRQQVHTSSPQLVMRGNNTTPSYGNVHVWINHLTPNGDGTVMDNMGDATIIGLDAEGWNLREESTTDALIYMNNMGNVKIGDVTGGNGYSADEKRPFDIDGDNLYLLHDGIGGTVATPLSEVRAGTNTVSVRSTAKPYTVAPGSLDFRLYTSGSAYDSDAVYLNDVKQTATITDPTAITDITNTVLTEKYVPYSRPVHEAIPDPLGANWEVDRIGKPDSHDYIQGLIDNNDVANLPEGIYYIGSTLTLDHGNNIEQGIIGSGTGKTVICGLTDDFPLITMVNTNGIDGSNISLAHLTLQGGEIGLLFPTDLRLIAFGLWKYVIFRDQTYGILADEIFGLDNNYFEYVSFINCDIGFYNKAAPKSTPNWQSDNLGYVDKTVFYKSQFINCGTGIRAGTFRANNLNLWLDCNFDGNETAAYISSNRFPIFVNCDFTNNSGGVETNSIIRGGEVSLYSCLFQNNTSPNIFSMQTVYLEGCDFLDNSILMGDNPHSDQIHFIANSTINGTLGGGSGVNKGSFLNNNFINEPLLNKLVVNKDSIGNITTVIDAPTNPYPQFFVSGDLAVVDVTPPTAPTTLAISNITSTSVDLTWVASTDAIGVTDYRVYNGVSLLATVGSNATSYTLTGLTPETAYNLTVRGLDLDENESTNSNTQSFTTLVASGTAVSSIYVEAEDMTIASGWGLTTDGLASGGEALTLQITINAFTSTPSAEQLAALLSTDLDLEGGTYKFWIRYKTAGTQNSVFVNFNNQTWGLSQNSAFPSSYTWEEVLSETYILSEGINSFKIAPREGMTLDRIYITKNGDTPI